METQRVETGRSSGQPRRQSRPRCWRVVVTTPGGRRRRRVVEPDVLRSHLRSRSRRAGRPVGQPPLESPPTDAAATTFVSGGVPLDTAGLATGGGTWAGLRRRADPHPGGRVDARSSPEPGLSAFGADGQRPGRDHERDLGRGGARRSRRRLCVGNPSAGSRLATSPDGSIVGWLGDDGAAKRGRGRRLPDLGPAGRSSTAPRSRPSSARAPARRGWTATAAPSSSMRRTDPARS